jgi:hypothetical protein
LSNGSPILPQKSVRPASETRRHAIFRVAIFSPIRRLPRIAAVSRVVLPAHSVLLATVWKATPVGEKVEAADEPLKIVCRQRRHRQAADAGEPVLWRRDPAMADGRTRGTRPRRRKGAERCI